jgi:hypothetical protein
VELGYNAHREERGGDKVRKLVGYWRYDTEDEVNLVNQIYEVGKSPYQRIMESSLVPEEVREALKEHYNKFYLVELKRKLDELLTQLFGGKMKGKSFSGTEK